VQPKASREEWQKRVERWRDSGLSAEQFASELGINANTLKFWSYKLAKPAARAEGRRQRKPEPAIASFVELRSDVARSAFEVELGNGRRLSVPPSFEPSALERLLAILERR
jgi:transposase-like protein